MPPRKPKVPSSAAGTASSSPAPAASRKRGSAQISDTQPAASPVPEVVDDDDVMAEHKSYPFKNPDFTTQKPAVKRGRTWKTLKQQLSSERYDLYPNDAPTYLNIEAGPSALPPRKYCDLTGLEAKYIEPRTKLRYASKELYSLVRGLPDEHVQALLALRNAQVQIK